MKKQRSSDDIDRLSELPDFILLDILTFLRTKEYVKTSALSKRYKTLYASLPDLIFDTSLQIHHFPGFLDQLLNLRDDSLKVNSFRLATNYPSKESFLKAIRYAVSHSVQHINIETDLLSENEVEDYCFSSADHLTSLRLSVLTPCYFFLWKLPCLKQLVSLHLHRAGITEVDFFSSFPCLEDLNLRRCVFRGDHLSICTPQLSTFTIYYCTYGDVLVLLAPKLNLFTFKGFITKISAGDDGFPLIEGIILDVQNFSLKPEKILHLVTNMLLYMRHAQSLTLSHKTVELLASKPSLLAGEPSPFANLKSLRFEGCGWYQPSYARIPDQLLEYFLKNSAKAKISY